MPGLGAQVRPRLILPTVLTFERFKAQTLGSLGLHDRPTQPLVEYLRDNDLEGATFGEAMVLENLRARGFLVEEPGAPNAKAAPIRNLALELYDFLVLCSHADWLWFPKETH
jgi:hypothetical protein